MKLGSSFALLIEVSCFKDVMSTTLYLLRQQPDRISHSLFSAIDLNMEVVSIEPIMSMIPSSYDDLIEKIFSSEQVIVL